MRHFAGMRHRDHVAGSLMALVGLGAVVKGTSYSIGTLSRMGPGFFPVALGTILALVGLAILLTAKLLEPEAEAQPLRGRWRGWLCIVCAIAAFIVLGKYGGLLPATFAIVFISALGDRSNGIRQALVLALGIMAVCIAVFWWALQLQFPLFGWS